MGKKDFKGNRKSEKVRFMLNWEWITENRLRLKTVYRDTSKKEVSKYRNTKIKQN